MRDVAVVGVGLQKWGELWEKSLPGRFCRSGLAAIDNPSRSSGTRCGGMHERRLCFADRSIWHRYSPIISPARLALRESSRPAPPADSFPDGLHEVASGMSA